MANVFKVWNGIRTDVCLANTRLSVKMAPKLCNFGAKMSSCLAIMVKIKHGHGFSLLPECLKL